MHLFVRLVVLLALLYGSEGLRSQDFQINGNATQLDSACYRLTDESFNVAGSIWNLDKINLLESFEVRMDIFLGCRDTDGADGIVFGFQPVSTSVGSTGQGIGFGGIVPSLGIEFDTWQNFDFGDPAFDHVAIFRDGNLNHQTANTLAGPAQALPNSPNIEDCQYHDLRVTWDAPSFTLQVYLNCSLRLTYTGDIVNQIFNGDPEVFWGFTAATGGAINRHEVCFRYTTFLDRLDDLVLCPNGQVRLQASGGVAYEWNPPEGLSNPNVPNPVASPDETTTYVVTVFDACGFALYDSLQVVVDGDTSFVELGPDTTICQGLPLLLSAEQPNASYLWSTGSTEPSIEAEFSGLVTVQVLIDEYCFDSDEILLTLKPQPEVTLEAPPVLCFGQVVDLKASLLDDPDATYQWQDGSTDTVFTAFQAGFYEVVLRNYCGQGRASVQLESEFCRGLYLGNVFSPNDDGFNDFFYPQDAGHVAQIQYFRIFDRWGGLVFEARNFLPNEPRSGWNGRVNGKPAAIGVYVWVLYGTWRDGLEFQRQGSVHLLR